MTLFGNKEDEKEIDEDSTLELVMRTKWGRNIIVDWNDSTRIL